MIVEISDFFSERLILLCRTVYIRLYSWQLEQSHHYTDGRTNIIPCVAN